MRNRLPATAAQHTPPRPSWPLRLKVQLISFLAFNGYFWAPWGKYTCLPVLNCYACTLATTACPIGTVSSFAAHQAIPFYVIGTLGLVGVTVGRAFCGWACPFGLIQDLLYRIRSPKWRLPRGANGVKYALLAVLVIAAPWLIGGGANEDAADRVVRQSTGAIDFCALVCPAGTLEAGVPSLLINKAVRHDMSWRSWLKLGLLALTIGLAIVSWRSFCRTFCPLGAAMAITSRSSFLRLETHAKRCTRCRACVSACPTRARQVPEADKPKEATAECLNCLECVHTCPEAAALSAKIGSRALMVSAYPSRNQPEPAEETGVGT